MEPVVGVAGGGNWLRSVARPRSSWKMARGRGEPSRCLNSPWRLPLVPCALSPSADAPTPGIDAPSPATSESSLASPQGLVAGRRLVQVLALGRSDPV